MLRIIICDAGIDPARRLLLHIYTFAFYPMENEEIEETPRDVTKWVILGAFIVIIASIVYVLATTDSPEKTKSSLDDKMAKVEQMRAEKKDLEKKIIDLNKKITKWKCEIFNQVKAKTQWEQDCQEMFELQKQTTDQITE